MTNDLTFITNDAARNLAPSLGQDLALVKPFVAPVGQYPFDTDRSFDA
jgi:hypothetical protein